MALVLPYGSNVVELGSFAGKSTAYLAIGCIATGSQLHCVDWDAGLPPEDQANVPAAIRDRLTRGSSELAFWNHLWNVLGELACHVALHRAKSDQFAETWNPDDKLSLLYIDANHSRCRQDFEAWLPHLHEHAAVAFDDVLRSSPYGKDGPNNVVAELLHSREWFTLARIGRFVVLTRDLGWWEERNNAYQDRVDVRRDFGPDDQRSGRDG